MRDLNLGRAPVVPFPILFNADERRGSELPETLGMFTEGRSQGMKGSHPILILAPSEL